MKDRDMDALPVAFVAMKFDTDAWRDKHYQVITEVLEEAGYCVVRGDEIRSAGSVATEVLQHLRDDDLIVVDLTGDSHNVSYELGYCHGVGRPASDIITLIARSAEIPFNYAHYRHLVYRDMRHLRMLLRRRLSVSVPLTDRQEGYALSFVADPSVNYLMSDIAESIIAALTSLKFSGRCEFYGADALWAYSEKRTTIGLGLKTSQKRKHLNYKHFVDLVNTLEKIVNRSYPKLSLDEDLCEITMMSGIRHDLLGFGVVEFVDGQFVRLLNPAEVGDTAFVKAVIERLGDDYV